MSSVGNLKGVKLLLDNGANPDIADLRQRSARFYALNSKIRDLIENYKK